MNKINIENYNDLKSWPFKEAQQILKRNGGLAVNTKKLREFVDQMIAECFIKEINGKAANGHTIKKLSVEEPWQKIESKVIDLVTGKPIDSGKPETEKIPTD